MSKLMGYVDVCIANEEDCEKVFGIHAEGSDVSTGALSLEGYRQVAEKVQQRFGCKKVAITLRGSLSASCNTWAAILYEEGQLYQSQEYTILRRRFGICAYEQLSAPEGH